MKKKIIISPFSSGLRNQDANNPKKHPKNYPYWNDLIDILEIKGYEIIQVGINGEEKMSKNCKFNLPFADLIKLLNEADLFIAVDNFFPHFAHHYKRNGIVLFSLSDPKIFGYKENINLYRDKKYFRPDQFGLWESVDFNKDSFVFPADVALAVDRFIQSKQLLSDEYNMINN